MAQAVNRSGQAGQSVTLGIKFYDNGSLFDPFNVGDTEVFAVANGGSPILDGYTPVRVSIGFYQVTIALPSTLAPGTYYDEWTWTAFDGMLPLSQRYCFTVTEEPVVDPPATVSATGCRPKPSWIRLMGLRRVDDVGNGMGIALAWEEARPADTNQQVHYNIYAADTRMGILENYPTAITTAQDAVINILPGNTYYFAVKATEFDTDFDITQFEQIGVDVYRHPPVATLQTAFGEVDGYTISVDGDISNYSDIGELLIETEIMRYTAIDRVNGTFTIPADGRGITQTTPQAHEIGNVVRFWKGIEDGNSVIRQGTATWHQVIPHIPDSYGEFNADVDGYRAVNEDIVTTDLSASDANTADFPHYDFKGYHRPSLQATFSGDCVGSYVGGEFNGQRGFNFQDRNLARLDAMLQVTGEPVVLLRRKWSGRRCKCMGMRREHQRTRCDRCFGTGFEGGYERFNNTRAISERFTNTCGFILIRVHPHTDDLDLKLDQGLVQDTAPAAWTVTYPTLKDRDIIVRFTEDGIEEFRYEINDVTRNKLFFGQSGKQEFRMRRLDKTDVIYQFDASCP